MDLSHLVDIDKLPIDTSVAADRRPDMILGTVAKLDAQAHPVAKMAAEKAIGAQTVSYNAHRDLANNLRVLESYLPGRNKVASSSEEINASIAKFNRVSSAAVTRGLTAAKQAETDLAKSEEQLQKNIREAITDKAITPDVAREIRQHMHSLGKKGAEELLRSSVGLDVTKKGDLAVLHSVMGAPFFLSALEEKSVLPYIEIAEKQHANDFVVQLQAVSAMKQQVRASRESLEQRWLAAQKVAVPRKINVFSSEA